MIFNNPFNNKGPLVAADAIKTIGGKRFRVNTSYSAICSKCKRPFHWGIEIATGKRYAVDIGFKTLHFTTCSKGIR